MHSLASATNSSVFLCSMFFKTLTAISCILLVGLRRSFHSIVPSSKIDNAKSSRSQFFHQLDFLVIHHPIDVFGIDFVRTCFPPRKGLICFEENRFHFLFIFSPHKHNPQNHPQNQKKKKPPPRHTEISIRRQKQFQTNLAAMMMVW